jgi:hypothetical protein
MMVLRWSAGLVAALLALAPATAPAQTAVSGKPVILAADPGDFVIQLDVTGPCGSSYFHVSRANRNFREMVSLALTAYATGSTMTLFHTGCAGDRNLISHGYAGR